MNKYARALISALLLGWIAWHTDWPRVADAFADLRVELWLAAVAILVACQVVSARRWQLFARQLGFDVSVKRLSAYYLVGMYFNLLLPTSVGGDVMRAWYLGGSARKLKAIASVLLDRLNGLLVLVSLAFLAAMLSPLPLPAWVAWAVWALALGTAVGMLALPAAARWRRLPEARRRQLRTVVEALHARRVVVEATAWSVVVQVANVVLVWLVGIGLGLDVPLGYYFVFVPMVALLTLLPVSVNGMGVREGGVVLFLAPLGVEASVAVTLAFLWFAVFGAVSLLGGIAYLLGGRLRLNPVPYPEVATHGPIGGHPDQGRDWQPRQAA